MVPEVKRSKVKVRPRVGLQCKSILLFLFLFLYETECECIMIIIIHQIHDRKQIEKKTILKFFCSIVVYLYLLFFLIYN